MSGTVSVIRRWKTLTLVIGGPGEVSHQSRGCSHNMSGTVLITDTSVCIRDKESGGTGRVWSQRTISDVIHT